MVNYRLISLALTAETEDHGAYRYRRTMDNNFRLVNVYITDMKITEIPQK
ncbi:hypothetical protein NY866_004016 [Salmonella enterica]|nr:hypothetical protein [Salmonella enterica]